MNGQILWAPTHSQASDILVETNTVTEISPIVPPPICPHSVDTLSSAVSSTRLAGLPLADVISEAERLEQCIIDRILVIPL